MQKARSQILLQTLSFSAFNSFFLLTQISYSFTQSRCLLTSRIVPPSLSYP